MQNISPPFYISYRRSSSGKPPDGPFRGRYFVTRQSTQNEGAQPLLRCVVSGDAIWVGLMHLACVMCIYRRALGARE